MKIIHTSKKFLKILACATILLTAHQAKAQQVTVDASIDSLQLLIGEQAKIKLEVSMDANQKLTLPALRDTIVRGVEILDIAKPDTQMLNDGRRMLIKQEYTITSFDSALYYLPPLEILVNNQAYRSKALALKVYSIPWIRFIRTILRTENSTRSSYYLGRCLCYRMAHATDVGIGRIELLFIYKI